MRNYESVFIARQDISTQQVDALGDTFAGIITEAGGAVGRREYWGLRKLAYRIKKNRKGHYLMLNFQAPAEAVAEMERQMYLNEDVMRYLTLRVDDVEEGPSVMMQTRDERPRREGRGRFDRDRPPREGSENRSNNDRGGDSE
ncbi:MAG: 30S ribosomal protein S6 [Magnetospiraceae bacterium]